MATHTNVSKLNKTFQSHFAHKELVWLLGLILALSLVFIGVNNLTLAPKADAFSVENRALQAWALRYEGLAAVQAVQAGASSQRAVAANSARYQGLADHYTLRDLTASQ